MERNMLLIKIQDFNSHSQTCTEYMVQLPVLFYYTHIVSIEYDINDFMYDAST